MTAFLLLIIGAVVGMVAARAVQGATSFAYPMNWWVLNVALPALVLALLPAMRFDWHLWYLPVSQWAVFLGAWIGFAALGRRFHWTANRVGALILTAGLGNTLFIGYPVVEAIVGRESLRYAIIADQIGTFLTFIVGGYLAVATYGPRDADGPPMPLHRIIVQRLIRVPAMYAILLGIAVGMAGGWHPAVEEVLLRIASTLTPIALFSAGLQFRFRVAGDQRWPLAMGLTWKLALGPLIAAGIGVTAGIQSPILAVGVLQAAMAPMTSTAILAEQHQLEPALANSMLAIGILLSILTLSGLAFVF